MFSDGVNRYAPELKDIKVKRVCIGSKPKSFRGTQMAIRINKAFSDIVGKEKPKLVIVNVNTQEDQARLPFGSVEPLMKQTAKENYPADIIWFPPGPSGHPPLLEESLKLMGQIRNKHVCLTTATHNSMETPAAEVISIGSCGFPDFMITSGILDFCLSKSESDGCGNLEEAVATAVGYIAGIICNIKAIYADDDTLKNHYGTYYKFNSTLIIEEK